MHVPYTRSPSRAGLRRFVPLVIASPLVTILTGVGTCGESTLDQPVAMRDGVNLITDAYPVRSAVAPTILSRTPYGRAQYADYGPAFNSLGYNLVAQDVRGTGDSGGEFMIFHDDAWGDTQDGYDTVQWTASQSWSDGNVCITGGSAVAMTSMLAAGSAPPALRCAYVLVAAGDLYHGAAYQSGVLREELMRNWLGLVLGETVALDATYAHPTFDDFWKEVALSQRYAQVNVPVYSAGGWYDLFTQASLDDFVGIQSSGGPQARGQAKMVVGPWVHDITATTVGQLVYPNSAYVGDDVAWFDHYLKGAVNGIEAKPALTYYRMGDVDTVSPDWNVWKTDDVWPVPATDTPLYLTAGGTLSFTPPGSSSVAPTRYTFNPSTPVPTLGGANLFTPCSGPWDQRPLEARSDVRAFTSAPLSQPLAITGRVKATLWVSSSAKDTDFTVKVTDVYPDGRSMSVVEGIVRMRYRDGDDHEAAALEPGKVYPVEVDLWSTSIVFNAGHRIRVNISSSSSPRFAVNPNTGGPQPTGPSGYDPATYLCDPANPGPSLLEDEYVVADQAVYHDSARLSSLHLPVVGL